MDVYEGLMSGQKIVGLNIEERSLKAFEGSHRVSGRGHIIHKKLFN